MRPFIQSNGQLMQELQKSTMINSQAIKEVKNATMVNSQAIAKIENQIGQIANHLGEREKRKFPSQPEPNPKAFAIGNSPNLAHGQEHVQVIVTLRLVRQVDNHVVDPEVDTAGQEREASGNKEERDAEPSTTTPIMKDPPRSFVPKAPYPERLQVPKKGEKFEDILEVFKQVQINIPFLDAI